MQFASAPMRIHVVDLAIDADGHETDLALPEIEEFADRMTAHYDDFAHLFPTLHKLREAAKTVAVARWLQGRGVKLSFPDEGRLTWDPPETVPSNINARVDVGEGDMALFFDFCGGVVLDPERSWNVAQAPVSQPAADESVAMPVPVQAMPDATSSRQESALEGDFTRKLEATTDTHAKVETEFQYSLALLEAGKTAPAASEVEKASEMDPDNKKLLLLRAQVLYNDGNPADAARVITDYLRYDPTNDGAQRMLQQFGGSAGAVAPPTDGSSSAAPGGLTPFQWQQPVAQSLYMDDERAPELTDIRVGGAVTAPPPSAPVPTIPDCTALLPGVVDNQVERANLVEKLANAPAADAPSINEDIKRVDASTNRVVRRYMGGAPFRPWALAQRVPVQPNGDEVQLGQLMKQVNNVRVPTPEVAYNFEPEDEEADKVLNGGSYGVAVLKGSGQFLGKTGTYVDVAATAIFIAGKAFIAAEDAAEVYVVRQTDEYESALHCLKDPRYGSQFAYLVADLRKGRHPETNLPDDVVAAAVAFAQSGPRSETILWDAWMSPEVRKAAAHKAINELASEAVGRVLDLGVDKVFEPEASASDKLLFNARAYAIERLRDAAPAGAVVTDSSVIATSRSILEVTNKKLIYGSAPSAVYEASKEYYHQKLVSPTAEVVSKKILEGGGQEESH
jgi:hypothetical protein